jgi:hypothetical protein
MRLISVAGACSRAGKTALAVTLLRSLPAASGTRAVKFTTTEDVFKRCPRGTACVVCDIDVPFRIVDDPRTLREPGTDTDRLAAAASGRCLWAIAKQAAARQAWEAVERGLQGAEVVVMEGSTVVGIARPELVVFVIHPFLSPQRWKPTSAALIADADLVVINLPAAETRLPAEMVLAEAARLRPRGDLRIGDVTRPLVDWAPDLLERVLRLAGRPARASA